jgi:Fe-S-cluster containining protein
MSETTKPWNIGELAQNEPGFARFASMDACTCEMTALGHSPEDAATICSTINKRVASGDIYKSLSPDIEILSKTGDSEVVVGGFATYEMLDPQGDVMTIEGQQHWLKSLFAIPEKYRTATYEHTDLKLGDPVLKYTSPSGKEYFSHVNEKGTYLIVKVRPRDGSDSMNWIHDKLAKGELGMFSISGMPKPGSTVERTENGLMVKYRNNVEAWGITLCARGMVPKAHQQIISKTVVEKGGCDTDVCGAACCSFMTQHVPRDDADAKAYLDLHGIESKSDGVGGLFVKMPVPCKALDPVSKTCTAHDKRPDICRVYPQQESPFIKADLCSLMKQKHLAKSEALPLPQQTQKPSSLNDSAMELLRKHGF